MIPLTMRAAAVSVPGSTSNLGPGFDVLGMAIDRAVVARFRPGDAPLEVVRAPELEDVPVEEDLLVAEFRTALRELGDRKPGRPTPADAAEHDPGGRLEIESDVPVGRGLGSSAAARAAGALLAGAVLGRVPGREALLERVSAGEGHADNAAPAVLGGLVAVGRGGDGELHAARLPLSPQVGFAFAEPGVPVRTDAARRALPATVHHALAAATAGRLALLLHGLAVADARLIAAGLHDELHVPWRLPLVPGAERARAAALAAGAWGVTLSGSGSGLIALGPVAAAPDLAAALARGFREGAAPGGRAFALRPDPRGARVLDHPPGASGTG